MGTDLYQRKVPARMSMTSIGAIPRTRRRPRAILRDWVVVGIVTLLVVVGSTMIVAQPRISIPLPRLGAAQNTGQGSRQAPQETAVSTVSVPPASPYYAWDYVWGLNHPAVGAPPSHAASSLMVDLDTRHVLFASQPHKHLASASTAKLMTAMVALDNSTPDTVVTVPDAAATVEPTLMGLTPGEKVPVGDLLYGLLLDSGNDAAETLAATVLGRDAFIRAMNDKAATLGLGDSHFAVPSGLDDPTQFTSAQDMAIIAGYLYQHYPMLEQVVTTKTQTIAASADHKAFFPESMNKMLWSYAGAIGFKTGFTDDAGDCLVTGARRGTHTLLLVELNDPAMFSDAGPMLDYGFRRAG